MSATTTAARTAPTIMNGNTHSPSWPLKKIVHVASDPKAPIMNTSPWAKLMSWTIP
jgi:hypothetical protein